MEMILLITISLFFIIAGLNRLIFNKNSKIEQELLYPCIPNGEKIIAITEILCGILIFTKYRCYALYILIIGILLMTFFIMKSQFKNVKQSFNKIATYRGSSSSVLIHILVLIIILQLLDSNHCF